MQCNSYGPVLFGYCANSALNRDHHMPSPSKQRHRSIALLVTLKASVETATQTIIHGAVSWHQCIIRRMLEHHWCIISVTSKEPVAHPPSLNAGSYRSPIRVNGVVKSSRQRADDLSRSRRKQLPPLN